MVPLTLLLILCSTTINNIQKRIAKSKFFNFLAIIIICLLLILNLHFAYQDFNDKFSSKSLQSKIQNFIWKENFKNEFIISEFPTLYNAVSQSHGLRTAQILKNQQKINFSPDYQLYYVYDLFCLDNYQRAKDNCEKFLNQYNTTLIKTFSDEKTTLKLYKVTN